MTHCYYRIQSGAPLPTLPGPTGCTAVLWRPRLFEWGPRGVPGANLARVWSLFHWTRIFANRDFSIVLVLADGRAVHRSFVFPRYARFPFMGPADLQVGFTWTAPVYRRRGVAAFALQEAVRRLAAEDRAFWYVTEQDNAASIRVAERAGLELAGTGRRVPRLGSRLLGAFVIEERVQG